MPECYCSRGHVHVQELACRSLGAKNAGSRDIWLIFSSTTLEGRKGTVRCVRGLDAHVLRVVFSKAEYVGRWVLLDFLALECLMDCDCPVQPGSQTTHSELGAVFSGREWVLGLSTGGNSDPGVGTKERRTVSSGELQHFSAAVIRPCHVAVHWNHTGSFLGGVPG